VETGSRKENASNQESSAGKRLMLPLQGALRTSALVMAVAFPHHAAQEKTAAGARAKAAGERLWREKQRKRRGGE
jgi:hypothetical protein